MHREIQMVAPDSVDGAVERRIEQLEVYALPSSAEIPQHEGQTEPGRQVPGFSRRRSRDETLGNLLRLQHDPAKRGQRDDALAAMGRLVTNVARHPVLAECQRMHRDRLPIDEEQADAVARARRLRAVQGSEPVPDRHAPQPQALLFRTQVDVFSRQFMFQLALEIVEKVVPSHAGKGIESVRLRAEVIHSPEMGAWTIPQITG